MPGWLRKRRFVDHHIVVVAGRIVVGHRTAVVVHNPAVVRSNQSVLVGLRTSNCHIGNLGCLVGIRLVEVDQMSPVCEEVRSSARRSLDLGRIEVAMGKRWDRCSCCHTAAGCRSRRSRLDCMGLTF